MVPFSIIFVGEFCVTIYTFEIAEDALSWFDAEKHAWVAEPGEFQALFAASSKDVRAMASFELK